MRIAHDGPTALDAAREFHPHVVLLDIGLPGTSGHEVAQAHLRYLNPCPRNTGDVLRRYEQVLVPEMNLGQLLKLLRAEYLVDAVGYNKVRGRPFRSSELAEAITTVIES